MFTLNTTGQFIDINEIIPWLDVCFSSCGDNCQRIYRYFVSPTFKEILGEKQFKLQNNFTIYAKTVLGVLVKNFVTGSNVTRRVLSSNYLVTAMFTCLHRRGQRNLGGDYIIYDNLTRYYTVKNL